MSGFELDGGQHAKRGVPALTVVALLSALTLALGYDIQRPTPRSPPCWHSPRTSWPGSSSNIPTTPRRSACGSPTTLVHQIEIAQHDQVTQTRFFNFGADTTITAPPGPYLPSNDN